MKFTITEESENYINLEVDRSEFFGMSSCEILEKLYSNGFQVINYKLREVSVRTGGFLPRYESRQVYFISAMKVAK